MRSQRRFPPKPKDQSLASRFLAGNGQFPTRMKLRSAATGASISPGAPRRKPSVTNKEPALSLLPRGGGTRTSILFGPCKRLLPPALFAKRVIDIVVAILGLIVCATLLALIAIAVKINSHGPVLYSASRLGKKGKSFTCFKFRTMIHYADSLKSELRLHNERQGAFFKIDDDPRITRTGKILRRYSLDELPQLWNVLVGEMSLVGPRPHPIDDCQLYRSQDLRRLQVTPGITGLWQVTARTDPSFQRNMALDLEYIERWSLSMDVHILYKTIFAVMQGTGA